MKKIFCLLIILLSIFSLSSCKKKDRIDKDYKRLNKSEVVSNLSMDKYYMELLLNNNLKVMQCGNIIGSIYDSSSYKKYTFEIRYFVSDEKAKIYLNDIIEFHTYPDGYIAGIKDSAVYVMDFYISDEFSDITHYKFKTN